MELSNGELRATPEYRQHMLTLIALQVTGLVLFGLLFYSQQLAFERELENRVMTAAARIERLYPDSFEQAAPALFRKPTASETGEGTALLSAYGYGENSEAFRPRGFAVVLLGGLMIPLNIFFYNRHQKRLFSRIKALSDSAVAAIAGKPADVDSRNDEGLLALFINRYNQLVKKFRSSTDALTGRRIFMEDIISDISHQLKTPMASLIMYNDLMIREPGMSRETRSEFLDVSRRQLIRMEWLIKSLLKLARLESGTIELEKKNLDVIAPVETALGSLAYLTGGIEILISDLRDKKLLIPADENWLAEAFTNILKNAAEHCPDEDGRIRVTIEETALFLRISIGDNGPGIAEKDLPRIFEKFYRSGDSTSLESVGIGLPLSKQILSAHNADLRVKNNPDEGAEFIVTIPY